ncbi:MAG: hypothetical protein JXB35_15015 [Anaerolineae bacterium]|nr:hypothetical protein [Anaerolineae bacterium]
MSPHGALTVDHVADVYRRYPGEPLVFHTRVTVHQPVSGYVASITLPEHARLDTTDAPQQAKGPRIVRWEEGSLTITWQVESDLDPGAIHEYTVRTIVAPTYENLTLTSRACIRKTEAGDILAEESASVAVFAKGQYLRHLPAVYEDDELMGRFLMLFESFWKPIEARLNQLPTYFDPRTAPPDLLPWMAANLDLTLDPRWSETKRRKLLRAIIRLYRMRGTRQGLIEYLEIFTGVRPQIVEHRASNFVLGSRAQLGQGLALGTQNAPHTFSVRLTLPPLLEEEARQRQAIIEAIIEQEKPAHTVYELYITEGEVEA